MTDTTLSQLQYRRVIALAAAMPWAIDPIKGEAILEVLAQRAQGIEADEAQLERAAAGARQATPRSEGVIAIIPVYGVIAQRMNMFSAFSGGTSIEQLAKQFDTAINDGNVSAILFDVDSPGGSVYGVPELAQKIFDARGKKPIYAIANNLMASAAYFIGSAADKVYAQPSGDVGSIGVYALHVDISGMDEQMGVKRTLVRAGRFKAEGHPYAPLSEEAQAHMQEMVNDSYEMFVEAVARQRGASVDEVKNGYGEGRVLTAKRALEANLIDGIATFEQVLDMLGATGPVESRSKRARELGPDNVSKEEVVVRVGTRNAPALPAEEPAAAVAAGTANSALAIIGRIYPDIDVAAASVIADIAAPRVITTAGTTAPPASEQGATQPRATELLPETASEARKVPVEGQSTAASGAVTAGADRAAEAQRETAIFKLCAAHGTTAQMADDYVKSGKSVNEVGLDLAAKMRAAHEAMTAAPVQLTEKEGKRYSICRAILAASGEGDDDSFEQEISNEIASKMPKDYKRRGGIFVPHRLNIEAARQFNPRVAVAAEVYSKLRAVDPGLADRFAALNTGTATAGGNTVFTDGRELIDFLYARMKVAALGATILSGLRGPVAFPRQTASSAWTWVAENPGSDVSDSDATIGQVLLSPKTGQASTAYSRQLLTESSIDVDGLVQGDLQMGAALGIDKAAIQGTGASNQPLGLTGITGVNLVSLGANGAQPTYDSMVDMETEVATDNADIGTMAYLTTPGMRGRLKKTQQFTGTNGVPVWQGNEVNGYRAEVSTQVPSNLTKGTSSGVCHAFLFGVWAQLLIGYWGAYELVVDPYRLKKQGLIEVTSFQMAGIACRNPESFCKILDALV